jgi:hypothetical protein
VQNSPYCVSHVTEIWWFILQNHSFIADNM